MKNVTLITDASLLLGVCCLLTGCGESANANKMTSQSGMMSDEKMSMEKSGMEKMDSDKMGMEKMSGDKMADDKMSGDKMKMGMEKMDSGKMSDDKMADKK